MVNDKKFEGNWSKDNNSKQHPFYFIETSETYNNAIKNCKEIRKSKVLTNLIIDKIELLSFPPTKESGKAWDNAFSSYKPDIFISITDFNKNSLYTQPNYYNNQTNKDLPLSINFEYKLKLTKEKYKDGIIINFYDHDSATSHDLLGNIPLNSFKEHYDSKKTVQTMKTNGIKAKVTFHYE